MKESSIPNFKAESKVEALPDAWWQLEGLPAELRGLVKQFIEGKMIGKEPIVGVFSVELIEKGVGMTVKVGFVQINNEENEITLKLHQVPSGEWKVSDHQWDHWYGGDDTDDGSDMADNKDSK